MVIEVNKTIAREEEHEHDRFINTCELLSHLLAAEKFDRDQLDIFKKIIDGDIEFEKGEP